VLHILSVYVCVCVCSLRYPARSAHEPCWHLWPARLYSIFPHYFINGRISPKKLLKTKGVLWFALQLLSEWWKIHIGLHVKYLLFLPDFNETRISLTDFRNSKTKFRKNPSSGSRVAPCGQTDVIFRTRLKIVQNIEVIPDISYEVNSFSCCLFMHQRLSVFLSLETLRIFNWANEVIVRLNRN